MRRLLGSRQRARSRRARWKINRKFTLRGELQYLFTNQDYKDWAYGLVELSFAPYLQVSVSDM